MRITILHHQYHHKGGMESYLFDLLKGFSQEKDEVAVFVYKENKKVPKLENVSVKKIQLKWLPRVLRRYFFSMWMKNKITKSSSELSLSLMRSLNQDLAICGGTHPGFLNHLKKKKNVWDCLEILFEKKSFSNSTFVIAHSEMIKNEIIKYYHIDPLKIHQFYPPIDTQRFSFEVREQRREWQKKYNIDPNKITLLFPSTGHKRKGFFVLFDAMKQLSADQFELIVVGNELPKMPSIPQVRYAGFVHDMAELYAAVNFTILPSLYEPFGLVAIESVQCGTPVIISQFVGAKDLLSSEESVLINELTPKGLIDAIQCAAESHFNILPSFAERHGLTIEHHVMQLKKLVKERI